MSKPSLFNLFKRGRYFRVVEILTGDDETAESKAVHRESERFAMGAIAFVFQYDSEFRAHFMRQIVGVENRNLSNVASIEVEPENWADLRLAWKDSDGVAAVHVVEAKVGASLQDKQDYTKPAFM